MIVIRNALEREAKVLAAIGIRAWRQATMALGITTPLYDNAASAFSNFTRSSWLAIRVAELGGSVAGWAAREHFDEAISDFWIDPDFQRRGIG
ncbi:GNAT family N-acetyltransferase, partial [Rhizobium sp. BR5]